MVILWLKIDRIEREELLRRMFWIQKRRKSKRFKQTKGLKSRALKLSKTVEYFCMILGSHRRNMQLKVVYSCCKSTELRNAWADLICCRLDLTGSKKVDWLLLQSTDIKRTGGAAFLCAVSVQKVVSSLALVSGLASQAHLAETSKRKQLPSSHRRRPSTRGDQVPLLLSQTMPIPRSPLGMLVF